MTMPNAWQILKSLPVVLSMLGSYTTWGVYLPFLIALRTIRLRRTSVGIVLRSWDPSPMLLSGFVTWSLPALFLPWGMKVVMVVGAGSLLFWLGFRVTVSVSPWRTQVVRKALFFIPWSWRVSYDRPRAFTDGWGDFLDPEALNIDLENGNRIIELAWSDKYSGTRGDDLAAEFNRAVDALWR